MNVWLLVVAVAVAGVLTAWLQAGGRNLVALDQPGERSLHSVPTPRTGGIAITVGMLPAAAVVFAAGDPAVRWLLVGLVAVFAVSLADDLRSLPFWVRLPVHLAAAALAVIGGGSGLEASTVLIAVIAIGWGTNLFNFMDGMDGLAGGMSLLGGSALAVVLAIHGAAPLALLVAAAALASGGFPVFNLPPARIFMGDAGSATLGYLFAAAGAQGVLRTGVPAWVPMLIFLPFLADATLTLAWRALQRKPVWRAHREHLYQRLVLSGVPVRRVLAAYGGAAIACGGAAIATSRAQPASGWLLLAGAAFLTSLAYCVIMARRR